MTPSSSASEYPGHVFVKNIGTGAYGVTKLFQKQRTGEKVAVKFLERGRQMARMKVYVQREILNHVQLSGHPSIVGFKEVFLTPQHLAIAMEYAAGGELFDPIASAGRFPEDVARYFFQQLISAVAWCHRNGVCHRDLKLENALLDRQVPRAALLKYEALAAAGPRLKLIDFGMSKSAVFDSQPKSQVGTPQYMAPEVMDHGPGMERYDGEVADVWSCGVLLYIMLVGCYPYEDPEDPHNPQKTVDRIQSARYSMYDVKVSPECADLLRRIFQVDPQRRITLADIQRHPWFLRNLQESLSTAALPGVARQTEAQIKAMVAEACTLGAALRRQVDVEDQYLEEHLDSLQPEEEEVPADWVTFQQGMAGAPPAAGGGGAAKVAAAAGGGAGPGAAAAGGRPPAVAAEAAAAGARGGQACTPPDLALELGELDLL